MKIKGKGSEKGASQKMRGKGREKGQLGRRGLGGKQSFGGKVGGEVKKPRKKTHRVEEKEAPKRHARGVRAVKKLR